MHGPSPVSRIDLPLVTALPPLHRPTVTGATGGSPTPHVGGGIRPPADDTVALSDGTHISFGAVEEIPVQEYA